MSKSYIERVKPTYIENWPAELCRLSIAQVPVKLTVEDAKAVGSNITELCTCFPPPLGQDISHIVEKVDEAVSKFPRGAFIRLGSRSPKDSWNGHENGFCVKTGKEAMRLLLDCSERIMEDLLLAIKENYEPYIWLRQWIDIPVWSEFRCFMRDRKLVGISQYDYTKHYPEIHKYKDSILWGIERFFPVFRESCHLDDVVFDIFVKIRKRDNTFETEVKLLEINPFFEMTDSSLFDWRDAGDFDGSFRYRER